MAMQRIALGAIIALVMIGMVASSMGALVSTRKIPNTGIVKTLGVEVYSDSGCTIKVSSIDWGVVEPGSSNQYKFYVKNEGNVKLKLSMSVSNWNPSSASSYLKLSWDRENYVLNAGSSVSATLTLSISSSISGITNFSFDIIITGTETT